MEMLTLFGIVVVIAGLYFGCQVLIPMSLAVVLTFFSPTGIRIRGENDLGNSPRPS